MRKDRWAHVEDQLQANLDRYLAGWGPIRWRDLLEGCNEVPEVFGPILWALATVEEDSRNQLARITRARLDRMTPVHQFSVAWRAEEAEHSRALLRMARLAGQSSEIVRRPSLVSMPRSIMGQVGQAAASPYHAGMVAAFLTLGAMQEHTALTTYNALAARDVPSQVKAVLTEIARQEGRHLRFYRNSAEAVMNEFPSTRNFVGLVVPRAWAPVGMKLLGRQRWESIFFPVILTRKTAAKLVRVDAILSEMIGTHSSPMARYLATIDAVNYIDAA